MTTSPASSPIAPPIAAAGAPQVIARAILSQAPSRAGPYAFKKTPSDPPIKSPAHASRTYTDSASTIST